MPAEPFEQGPSLSEILTPREFEALRLIAEGDLTYAEAARRMGVRESTVKEWMASVRRKLGVVSRGAAMVEYWRSTKD